MWRAIPAMLAWKCPTRKWVDFRLWEKFVAFPLRQVFRFRTNGIKIPRKLLWFPADKSSDSPRMSQVVEKSWEIPRKTSWLSQKTSEFFPKTWEIFPKTWEKIWKMWELFGELSEKNKDGTTAIVVSSSNMELFAVVLSYEICRCRNENFGNSKYMCKFVRKLLPCLL